MGYTHTWTYLKPSLSVKDWTTLTNVVKTLIANLPEHSTSAGGYYKDEPLKLDDETTINKDQVAFNGDGEDLSHETFVLERSWRKGIRDEIAYEKANQNAPHVIAYFEKSLKGKTAEFFCKTARKPYDLLVCGVLAVACHLFPEWIAIHHDREDGDYADWVDACAWAAKVTGYDIEVPPGVPRRLGDVSKDGAVQVLDGTQAV